jgi:high-affinity iron transporter
VLEGVVMLAASAVLFYVSYWLIAQSQTKKWIDFLKSATKKGIEGGGFATIGLTAFLAIYREGAETALMYQALLTNQTATGVYGILSGLCTGLVLLSILAVLIRFASLKLPLQAFFKYTGMMLFGLAVIFAGKGVFELQAAAVLKTTSLAFPWPTVPDLGLYPNLQVFLIQAIMVVGAIASVFVIKSEGRTPVKGAKLAGVNPEAVSAPSAEDFDQPVESESLEPVAASRD